MSTSTRFYYLKYRPSTDLFYCDDCGQAMRWEMAGSFLYLHCRSCGHSVDGALVDIETARTNRISYLQSKMVDIMEKQVEQAQVTAFEMWTEAATVVKHSLFGPWFTKLFAN